MITVFSFAVTLFGPKRVTLFRENVFRFLVENVSRFLVENASRFLREMGYATYGKQCAQTPTPQKRN